MGLLHCQRTIQTFLVYKSPTDCIKITSKMTGSPRTFNPRIRTNCFSTGWALRFCSAKTNKRKKRHGLRSFKIFMHRSRTDWTVSWSLRLRLPKRSTVIPLIQWPLDIDVLTCLAWNNLAEYRLFLLPFYKGDRVLGEIVFSCVFVLLLCNSIEMIDEESLFWFDFFSLVLLSRCNT